jgi:catechol 2,3-dioxygenase-like lactoylglutathione lyase family enzyme
MTVPSRLSVATIGARDVANLRAFYERLGWTTNTEPGGDFAAFPLGGAVFCLFDMGSLAEEAGTAEPPPPDAGFRGVTLSINVDEKDDVPNALATAREAGATILAEPVDRDWGGRSAYFADPEGNVWEIAWLPGASFDDRGALIWPF